MDATLNGFYSRSPDRGCDCRTERMQGWPGITAIESALMIFFDSVSRYERQGQGVRRLCCAVSKRSWWCD